MKHVPVWPLEQTVSSFGCMKTYQQLIKHAFLFLYWGECIVFNFINITEMNFIEQIWEKKRKKVFIVKSSNNKNKGILKN